MVRSVLTGLILAATLCLNTACATPALYSIGNRLEVLDDFKATGSVVTGKHLVLAYTAKIYSISLALRPFRQGDYGAESARVVDRWATVKITDITEKKKRLKFTYHTTDPLASTSHAERKVLMVSTGEAEPCLEAGKKRDMCLVNHRTSLTGTVLLPTDGAHMQRFDLVLSLDERREYRETWAYPVLVLLTPVAVAIDLTIGAVVSLATSGGGRGTIAQLEREAKGAKRGLWADPHAAPPWEWRGMRKRYR